MTIQEFVEKLTKLSVKSGYYLVASDGEIILKTTSNEKSKYVAIDVGDAIVITIS